MTALILRFFLLRGAHETFKAACISNNCCLTLYLLIALFTSYSKDHLCMAYGESCWGAAMSQRSAVCGMEQSQICACLCSASPFLTPGISIHHLERAPAKCHGQGSGERWARGFPGSAHLHRLRLSALFLNWRVLSCLFKHFLFCLVICGCITHSYLPSLLSSPFLANLFNSVTEKRKRNFISLFWKKSSDNLKILK